MGQNETGEIVQAYLKIEVKLFPNYKRKLLVSQSN